MFIYRKEVLVPITGTADFNIELTNFPDVHPPNLMIAVESFHYKCWSQFGTLMRPIPYKTESGSSAFDVGTKFGDLYVQANNDTIMKTMLIDTAGLGSFSNDTKYAINDLGIPVTVPPDRMINFKLRFTNTRCDQSVLIVDDLPLPDLGITYQYFVDAGYIQDNPDYRQPINQQNCFITFSVIIYSSA